MESALDEEESTDIIRGSFAAKLHNKLHLPQDKEISPDTHLEELCVDSLVAVDLRMWFAKELGLTCKFYKSWVACRFKRLQAMQRRSTLQVYPEGIFKISYKRVLLRFEFVSN